MTLSDIVRAGESLSDYQNSFENDLFIAPCIFRREKFVVVDHMPPGIERIFDMEQHFWTKSSA